MPRSREASRSMEAREGRRSRRVLGGRDRRRDLRALRPPHRLHLLGRLFVLALASALVVGYASARDQQRSWFRTWLFAVVIAICIFVILDLEHPRIGIVRVDEADRLLEELLAGMK